jgi:non-specific serine/threonine protein kinase/serine/threonine-protein kinase
MVGSFRSKTSRSRDGTVAGLRDPNPATSSSVVKARKPLAAGKVTTTATDVYSLGVVLYELLTGMRPFDFKGKSLIEISDALQTQRPVRPSDCQVTERAADLTPTTPALKGSDTFSGSKPRQPQTSTRGLKGDLDNIILQAIRREPERRYQSVVEFSDDIERYLAGLPVKATADTVGYRARKFARRHRTAVTATVSLMLLLLVSTGLTGWQYVVARTQRAKAEHRLTDLRGVAKSLLTETNAQLSQLPQGFEIRKSIVEKSVAVLDNLAGDESNAVIEALDIEMQQARELGLRRTDSRHGLGQ